MRVDGQKIKEREEYIKRKRGEIAINFAFIENVINRVVTFHYFKKNNEAFSTEVMEDEYFSFGAKVKILKKITKNHYPKFPNGKLDDLGRLRNIITHSVLKMSAQVVRGTNDIISVNEMKFRHGGKDYNIDELFSQFDKATKSIIGELEKIPGGSPGKIVEF